MAMLTGQCSYKLAEKVSDRLTEMSQDLSSMIEEINSVSAALSKTNKPDNPVSVPCKLTFFWFLYFDSMYSCGNHNAYRWTILDTAANMFCLSLSNSFRRLSGYLTGIYHYFSKLMKVVQACNPRSRQRRRRVREWELMDTMASGLIRQTISIVPL